MALGGCECPSASIRNAARALAVWRGQPVQTTTECLLDLRTMTALEIDALAQTWALLLKSKSDKTRVLPLAPGCPTRPLWQFLWHWEGVLAAWKYSYTAAFRGPVVALCMTPASCLLVPVLGLFCVTSQSEVAGSWNAGKTWFGRGEEGDLFRWGSITGEGDIRVCNIWWKDVIKSVNNGHVLEIHFKGRG